MKSRKTICKQAFNADSLEENNPKIIDPASATKEEILANWRGFFI